MAERFVVIGAGEAGARAAAALRENGFAGSITLLGDEAHLPYERPPLSKVALTGGDPPSPTFILTEPRLAEHGIEWRHRIVTAIDRVGHAVRLAGGEHLAYDRLLIATGARARRLSVAGAGPDDVLYLRSFGEALALRDRFMQGKRVAIIGGGFIGLELAAAARARGAEVIVIEMAPRLLARAVPVEIAAIVEARHRAEGVEFRIGAAIDRVERIGERRRIHLAGGESVDSDGIVAGIGAVPETALAESAGLAIENGIRVDARLQTSDADIFAAGDCCSFPHPLFDGRRIRLEAWRNAQDQGNSVARAMLGGDAPHEAVPWFWSDQYDITLQIAGLVDAGAATVARDIGADGRLLFHLAADGRLVAASAVGANAKIAREIRLAEMLIGRRAYPAPEALASPEVKLKSLLAA